MKAIFEVRLGGGCLLFFVLLFLAVHANASPTSSECVNAWKGSDASGECGKEYKGTNSEGDVCWYADTSRYHVYAQSNACQVWVDCLQAPQSECERLRANNYSGSLDQTDKLRNCDGVLRPDPC